MADPRTSEAKVMVCAACCKAEHEDCHGHPCECDCAVARAMREQHEATLRWFGDRT